MNNMKQFWLLGLFLVVFMVGSSMMYDSMLGKMNGGFTEEDLHNQVPDFSVYDASGAEHQLSDYFGQPLIINFWGSWCGPCKSEMPLFQQTYEAYGEEIRFLMINATYDNRETVESAQKFIANSGYTFPVLFDTTADAAATCGSYSLPTTLFIDAEGSLHGYVQGPVSAELMAQALELLLN